MRKTLSALGAAVLLAGCASYQQGRPYYTLRASDFAPLASAPTTKADVERTFGRPLTAMIFARQGEEVWDYRFLNGTFVYIAEIHFDLADGHTKYYKVHYDRCPLSPVGCYG